jgi:small subunit ribosomal protein S14
MATKSSMAKKRRKETIALNPNIIKKRAELKKAIIDFKKSDEERREAMYTLTRMPKDTSRVRLRNRCQVTGRARGFLRKFGVSRLQFRELALRGELPGVTKSSW